MRPLTAAFAALVTATVLASCTSGGGAGVEGAGPGGTGGDGTGGGTNGAPSLEVEVVASGLSIPWDVQLLPDGTALVGERAGRLVQIAPGGGDAQEVDLPLDDFFAGSEGGLMGLAVSPGFDQDRTVYACYATQASGSPQDVRVVRLALDGGLTSATPEEVLVDELPITSGRHSGCRLLLVDDVLLVGTGDAADEVNPQSLSSLGGKVLAVTTDGEPLPGAPFVDGGDPRILTYGHRNVQGLARQPERFAGGPDSSSDAATPPGTGAASTTSEIGVPGVGVVWSVEHGPDVDDEVNVLRPGGNYGWAPGPGYDEGVPMTDLQAFPDAVEAAWSSGRPTHATSGAVFLEGSQWGAWDGALAVAELKGSGVTVLAVDAQEGTDAERVPELDGTHGRLRSLTLDEEGALWVTTSNGEDDQVLRVTPAS